MYYVYIILCGDNSLYTGIAKDVEKRFVEHKIGKGSKYVRSRKAKKMVYKQGFKTRSLALKREAQIKSWNKEKKLTLINKPKLKDFTN